MQLKRLAVKKLEEDGRIFVFDIKNLNLLEVDEATSDVLDLYGMLNEDGIINELNNKYEPEKIRESIKSLNELLEAGKLTVEDEAREIVPQHQLHLVPHIHWNREWFLTFQRSQIRLVDIINHVLDVLDNDPDMEFYTLDGHTALLEDYLEIRPENKERITEYMKQGRLLIGPWYIETNQFLVSGESIIRNLMLGRKLCDEFGGIMKVGYLPDAPGHISQMPQLLRGFDITSAVIYRGVGARPNNLKTEFTWLGPDGSSVLLVYMPTGFNTAHTLKMLSLPDAFREITNIQRELVPRMTTPNILLMSSTFSPLTGLSGLIKQLNTCIDDGEIVYSNLQHYIESVKQAQEELEVISGELLDCRGVCITPGVLSSRIIVKQENERVQTALEKWAEPFSTFAWMFGAEYPESHLWLAWKHLLHNQFGDTISGTCIDEVYDEVKVRFRRAKEIAEVLTERSLKGIVSGIDTKEYDAEDICLVVFNPLSWQRTDLVEAVIDIPWAASISDIALYDSSGKSVAIQIGKVWTEAKADMVPLIRPFHQWVKRASIAFQASDVPGHGYKTYRLSFKSSDKSDSYKSDSLSTISNQPSVAENEYLKVEIKENGTLTIIDKSSGAIYKDCNLFEDVGDAGDLYTFTPSLWDTVVTSSDAKAEIELVENGPVYARYKVEIKMDIPFELAPYEAVPEEVILAGHPLYDLLDEEPYPARTERSSKRIEHKITSYITLASGSRRVDVITEVNNQSKEHRLRVLFPSDIKTEFSYADTPFDVVKRAIELPYLGGDEEDATTTYPLSTFVELNDGNRGLAIISNGLPEYEVKDDNRNTIALTLLRCTGWLNRDILYNRRRHLAPVLPTPKAQCIGKHIFSYSIFPHSVTWEAAKVYQQAYQHNVPMKVLQKGVHDGVLEKEMSFLKCTPEELIISAIKKAEREDAIIVRLYNIGTSDIQGKLTVCEPIKRACIVNLNEEPTGEEISLDTSGTINVRVKGHQIVTIEIFLKEVGDEE